MSLRDRIDAALAAGAARRGEEPPVRRTPGSPRPRPPAERKYPCRWRGAAVLRKERCPSCRGEVYEHVFGCSGGYGDCTVAKAVSGVGNCCRTCDRYALPPPPPEPDDAPVVEGIGAPGSDRFPPVGLRHLVYHVYPVENGVWEKGANRLRASWGLFTGRKIVTVATGGWQRERTERAERGGGGVRTLPVASVERVRSRFPADAEVVEVPNHPTRWELSGWDRGWPLLFSKERGEGREPAADDDVVLYAHAKGSTRRPQSPCQGWADLLYRIVLDHWSVTHRTLLRFPLAGALLRYGRFFPHPNFGSKFHYAGNFWWARVGPLRDRLTRYVHTLLDGHSAEAWLGWAYNPADAGSVFTPALQSGFLYVPSEVAASVEEYLRWLRTNPPEKTPPTARPLLLVTP